MKNNLYFKNLSKMIGASGFSLVFSLAITPIMTRIFLPSDYGLFAVINNTATFIATFFLFSLPNALPLEKSNQNKLQLISTLRYLIFFTGIITLIIVVIFIVFNYLNDPNKPLDLIYFTIPVLVVTIMLHRFSQGFANSYGHFNNMSIARIVHPLISKLSSILFAVIFGASALFLILFESIGYIFQSKIMFKGLKEFMNENYPHTTKLNLRYVLDTIKKYSHISFYLHISNLLTVGNIALFTIIISTNFSSTDTGHYSLALSMTSLPIQLIALAVAPVIYHKFIELREIDSGTLFKSLFQTVLMFFLLGLIPYVVIFQYGDILFEYVFGNEWEKSGMIASYLALPLLMQFIYTPISSIFRVTNTTKIQFLIDLMFNLVIIIGFFILTLYHPLIYCIMIISFMITLNMTISIIACFYVSYHFKLKTE